jgi:hypothetical protein
MVTVVVSVSAGASLLRWVAWSFLVLVGGATGCAETEIAVKTPARATVSPGSHRGEGRLIVMLRPFADKRTEQSCGMTKSGYNTEMGKILCAEDPTVALAHLIAVELAASGFKVLGDEKRAGPSTIVLSGSLTRLFVEPKRGFFSGSIETDIELDLRARTRDGLTANRTFYVKGDNAVVTTSKENVQQSFDSGVRQLLTAVVGAVANLVDNVPAPPAVARSSPPPTVVAP